MLTNSTLKSFGTDYLAEGLTIVDFWAIWCGPCKAFEPIFEASAANHPEIKHLKIDVDTQLELARFFEISSIPTTLFIRDGYLVGLLAGALTKSRLEDLIEQSLGLDMEKVRVEGRLIKDMLE